MTRLAVSVFVSGLVIGQTFNGPVAEAFGLYLMGVAAVYIVVWLIASLMMSGDEPYVPSVEYAEDFAARLGGAKKPGSASLSSEGSAPNAEPGDIVYAARTGPRDVTTRTTPADGSPGRSAAEKDRPLHIVH